MNGDAAPATVHLTGYGVVSAAGVGGKALLQSVLTRSLPHEADAEEERRILGGERPPGMRLLPVPDFDPGEHLGRKGLRHHSRTTTLGMTACQLALDSLPEPVPEAERPDTGVVLGTSTGSARAITEFFQDTYRQERPYLVSPSLFPGILLNHCASQFAMRHAFTGPNASLAGGRVSSLSALRYARGALVTGQARRLLAGGVEELSAQAAWAWHRAGGLGRGAALGEGGAAFVLERVEPAGDAPASSLAELLACEVGFRSVEEGPLAVADALAGCVRDALAAAGAAAGDVSTVAAGASGAGGGWPAVEARGRGRALAGGRPYVIRVEETLGETYSASGALQLAALLAHWDPSAPAGEGELGLVTSVGADGAVACAVLRRTAGHRN
ncbi:beta-ketoacyl synthase N-terminal-like domain-containing protein [Allostreptomyces psammosilenae]|uniref:3-oxoacyl-[acyl-carrier-protein] synthase II n=1 Tax=Allostreptomyces psammosilenae TaxID=1892865 RepID=A0A852ZZR8_9ACTN|nr:beta-ketoacyl synthase N-terminal-like domain-containing protein [Allostreptomyces psammosilenae]NYI04071.1 3-oxoacyl-[acyl-carrier-protein] synthase II [Allostreptomyces psammosilenae]